MSKERRSLGLIDEAAQGLEEGSYGVISLSGGASDLSPTTTPETITSSDTEQGSAGITASHAQGSLTVVKPGAYSTFVSIKATVEDATDYTVYLAKNGVQAESVVESIERNVGELALQTSGIIKGLLKGDEITVQVSSNNGAGATFTPSVFKITMTKVGS